MSNGVLVTGTDTGVGKTAVSAGLLAALRRRGVPVAALKLVETGWSGGPDGWPPDGACLVRAAGLTLPREQVVPYALPEPLAPTVAARRAGVTIDPARLEAAYTALARQYGLVLVEGAGGLAVPVTDALNMADLAAAWRLPVLVVARPGLGSINHTVLTVCYARAKGLQVLGVVINGYPATPGVAEVTNPAVIAAMTGVPLLGVLPHLPDVDVEACRTGSMAAAVEHCLNLEPILALRKGDVW